MLVFAVLPADKLAISLRLVSGAPADKLAIGAPLSEVFPSMRRSIQNASY